MSMLCKVGTHPELLHVILGGILIEQHPEGDDHRATGHLAHLRAHARVCVCVCMCVCVHCVFGVRYNWCNISSHISDCTAEGMGMVI